MPAPGTDADAACTAARVALTLARPDLDITVYAVPAIPYGATGKVRVPELRVSARDASSTFELEEV